MLECRYGGKDGRLLTFDIGDDLVVVRGRAGRVPRRSSRDLLESLQPVAQLPEQRVEVLKIHRATRAPDLENVLEQLKQDRGLDFAGHTLIDPTSHRPVVYTENVFVKFHDDVTSSTVTQILSKYRLRRLKRTDDYAGNSLFAAAPDGIGRDVFDIAMQLLETNAEVELAHPELLRERSTRVAYPLQWHLRATEIDGRLIDAHASCEAAWQRTRGEGATIAIIDDGVDVNHVEFRAVGGVVAPRDVVNAENDGRPRSFRDNHGTACAGVACAAGVDGASGVAPGARLMPIRLTAGLGSRFEDDAFVWAATHGADVISCSWGPVDGAWHNPLDPIHDQVVPVPDHTRLAIEFAATQGRDGRGCVITWAAGNGNESVDNDGYASHPDVIAVGSCNDRSRRSVYSDFGEALWCCFPSNDFHEPLTTGIWTTDRIGQAGYNPGSHALGHPAGDYTNNFGGTSSAAPGVAGTAALMLAVAPQLDAIEVRQRLRDSCDKIDLEQGEYDEEGHSLRYGYGRINAARAVDELP